MFVENRYHLFIIMIEGEFMKNNKDHLLGAGAIVGAFLSAMC